MKCKVSPKTLCRLCPFLCASPARPRNTITNYTDEELQYRERTYTPCTHGVDAFGIPRSPLSLHEKIYNFARSRVIENSAQCARPKTSRRTYLARNAALLFILRYSEVVLYVLSPRSFANKGKKKFAQPCAR